MVAPQLVKNASREIRLGFVRKVYGLLSVQLAFTVLVAAPICIAGPVWARGNQWVLAISMVLLLVTMCAMCCCQESLRTFPTNYLFLLAITGAMSVLVGFASAMYTWQSVVLAAGITVVIFGLMTAYAWTTKRDFTGAGPYLFAAMMVLLTFGLVISVMGMFGAYIRWVVMMYNFIGVLIFTFYIIFDTQLIMGEFGGHRTAFSIDDYAFASLSLYLDIVNLFLHLLSLLGDNR